MSSLQKDIEGALVKFPTLSLYKYGHRPVLAGDFIARDATGQLEIDVYQIKLWFPAEYPYAFPFVMETSGKIPLSLSRHVREDGTLCFANPQDEYTACKQGINLSWFLHNILNAHLCREFVREQTGKYPHGERSHGTEGIWEGYYELFGTIDKVAILQHLDMVFQHPVTRRNDPCYCGGAKKYKVCHLRLESEVIAFSRYKALTIYEILKNDYKQNI